MEINISSKNTRIDFDNLFLNRIGRSDMVEKGNSIKFRLEFEKQNLNDSKILILNLQMS